MKYTDIGSQLQSKVVLSQPCRDSTEEFAKGFCMSVAQEGANKCLSQEAILDMYQMGLKGMQW